MSLQENLNQDTKEAMKAGDSARLSTLRMLSAAIHNREIEKGKDAKLTEEEVLQVLAREAKKRRESIEAFTKGGRPELAEKEQKELALIEAYLPKQMSREEVAVAVERVIVTLRRIRQAHRGESIEPQAQGDVVFNNVMKAVMQELKGKADGKMISEVVKEKLAS